MKTIPYTSTGPSTVHIAACGCLLHLGAAKRVINGCRHHPSFTGCLGHVTLGNHPSALNRLRLTPCRRWHPRGLGRADHFQCSPTSAVVPFQTFPFFASTRCPRRREGRSEYTNMHGHAPSNHYLQLPELPTRDQQSRYFRNPKEGNNRSRDDG